MSFELIVIVYSVIVIFVAVYAFFHIENIKRDQVIRETVESKMDELFKEFVQQSRNIEDARKTALTKDKVSIRFLNEDAEEFEWLGQGRSRDKAWTQMHDNPGDVETVRTEDDGH